MAIAVVGSTRNNSATATTSCTITNYISGSGTDLILVVGVANSALSHGSGNMSTTGITFNSVALTKIDDCIPQGLTGSCRGSLWRLINPGAATANLVVSFGATGDSVVWAATFSGVDQTTPLGTLAKDETGSTSTSISLNVPSAVGDLVVDLVTGDTASAVYTIGGSQTSLVNVDIHTHFHGAGSYKAGAATQTNMAWTQNAGFTWGAMGVALKPSASLPTQTYIKYKK